MFSNCTSCKTQEVIKQSLNKNDLPIETTHKSHEVVKFKCEKVYLCDYSHLKEALTNIMETDWGLIH